MNSREKTNLLDLKFFNVLLLHLKMRLFSVAAGPRDLRMDINVKANLQAYLYKHCISNLYKLQNLPQRRRSLQNEGCWFSSLPLFSSGQT